MYRFECQKECGKCCIARPGDNAKLIFKAEEYERVYSRFPDVAFKKWNHLYYLETTGACPFLKGTMCSIHEIRPDHCRTYPFWRANMAPEKWEALKEVCPGIGVGRVHTKFETEDKLRRSDKLGPLELSIGVKDVPNPSNNSN